VPGDGVSERRGRAVLRFNGSSHRHRAICNDLATLEGWIRELPAARVRYGYFRIYIPLCREGWKTNHKRVYPLYRQEGPSMRLRRPRRHVMAAHRAARTAAGAINENWSIDFVSDALFDGRHIRASTVVDDYSREGLAIEVGQSTSSEQVATVMKRLRAVCGAPKRTGVDNGPECVSRETRSVRVSTPGHARLQPTGDRGSRPTTRWSNLSTEGCETNAFTPLVPFA
jgi:putative transposase